MNQQLLLSNCTNAILQLREACIASQFLSAAALAKAGISADHKGTSLTVRTLISAIYVVTAPLLPRFIFPAPIRPRLLNLKRTLLVKQPCSLLVQ